MTSVYALLQTHVAANLAQVLDPDVDAEIAAGVQGALLLRVDRERYPEVDKLPVLRGALPHARATELLGVDDRGRLRAIWELKLPTLPEAPLARKVLPTLLGAPPSRPLLWEPVTDPSLPPPRTLRDLLGRDRPSALYVVLDLRNRAGGPTYSPTHDPLEAATSYAAVRAELGDVLDQARARRAGPIAVDRLRALLALLDLCASG